MKHDIFKLNLSFHIPLELEAAQDNRQPFVAIITFAGAPSDGAVGGTEGIPGGPYRILIPVDLMTAKIEDLIGKGVFAAPTLDTHAGAVRIGRFTDAWSQRLVGSDIEAVRASGFFDRGREKDLVGKVIQRARSGEMGFSYDLKNALVELIEIDGETIAQMTDFEWRGATVLYRQTAAYQYTDLAARISASSTRSTAGDPPQPTHAEELELTKEELQNLFASNLKPISDGQADLKKSIDAIENRVKALEGAGARPPAQTGGGNDGEIAITDLVSGIAKAVTEAIKPLADKLEKAAGAPAEPGKRKTFSAEAIETYRRYGGEVEDGGEPDVESLSRTINQLKASTALSPNQKAAGLESLVNMKLAAQRAARQAEALGIGGDN